MDRRYFLKSLGAASAFAALPASFKLHAAPGDYSGKLLVNVQCHGGWDVTSFCDPKMNVSGEREINRWARTGEIGTVGNLSYAPIGDNANFFQKYYRDMLVINGIDSQTNSHTAGLANNVSGRLAEGFPTLTALFASINAPNLPFSLINNGGYSHTGDLIRYTRLGKPHQLLNLLNPNKNKKTYLSRNMPLLLESDWDLITAARNRRLSAMTQAAGQTARQARNRANYQSALNNSGGLSDFAAALGDAGELQPPVQFGNLWSNFKGQTQLALLAMSSGVTCAADLLHGGFDTHQNHDAAGHELLSALTDGLDYLWTYAEQLGIADRLVVVVTSDFGRTPFYNNDDGKDHWPVTSTIVMERNTTWGNRVVGATDAGHHALAIDTQSMQADTQGSYLYSKDVVQGLRNYLNIGDHANADSFNLATTENFNFFGS